MTCELTSSIRGSEYFRENAYTTFQDDWVAFQTADLVDWHRLLWANDFSHSDSTWPDSQQVLVEQTHVLTPEQKRAIPCDNVAELYGIDATRLSCAAHGDGAHATCDPALRLMVQGGITVLGLARPLLSLAGLLVALSLSVDARAGTPLCPAGQFSATGFQPCEPCPAGRYADFVGAIECTACAPGTFANSTGSTSCQQCAPGSAAGAEAGFCLACAPGQFAPLAGSASCQLCPPGTAQPLPGETSCIDCAAGTHQPESGAASCLACPRNTYASQSRAVTCSNCGCDDEVACTRDGCDAVTAQCSAEPVAGCSVQTISFAGTLTRVDDALAACFELGSPVSGSWQVDPEAPDADAADPTFGSFYGALSGFEMRIGIGGAEIVTSAERATAFTRDALGQDVLEIDAEHPLTGTPVACGTRSDAILQLLDATDATRATDALPVGAEELNAFPNAEALLAFEGNGLVSSADIVFTPEPEGGSALALALLGIIQASSRARRRRA